MSEKKYALTSETITINGATLHRIQALRDFKGVKKGDLGGFIQKESNLSHDGNAWADSPKPPEHVPRKIWRRKEYK